MNCEATAVAILSAVTPDDPRGDTSETKMDFR